MGALYFDKEENILLTKPSYYFCLRLGSFESILEVCDLLLCLSKLGLRLKVLINQLQSSFCSVLIHFAALFASDRVARILIAMRDLQGLEIYFSLMQLLSAAFFENFSCTALGFKCAYAACHVEPWRSSTFGNPAKQQTVRKNMTAVEGTQCEWIEQPCGRRPGTETQRNGEPSSGRGLTIRRVKTYEKR